MAKQDTDTKPTINTRELANLRRILKGRRELLDDGNAALERGDSA